MSELNEEIVVRGFVRSYRTRPVLDRYEQVHYPYEGRLHDPETDVVLGSGDLLWRALRRVPEGEIVEVLLRRTGEQSPLADDPWVLQKSHVYGPNSEVPHATEPVDGRAL